MQREPTVGASLSIRGQKSKSNLGTKRKKSEILVENWPVTYTVERERRSLSLS